MFGTHERGTAPSSTALLRLQFPRGRRGTPGAASHTTQATISAEGHRWLPWFGGRVPGNSDGEHPPNNLPLKLSSFVGREREVAKIESLLAGNRLLTLTGPGGSGKTRLALRVASEALGSFDDGAWLVELAPLSDPDLVVQTVASVLGVREASGSPRFNTLADHLRPKRLLLVLDNCEHVVGASASLVDSLLRRCQNLSILATSRRREPAPRLQTRSRRL